MAGAKYTVTVDDKQVRRALQTLSYSMTDLSPVMQNIGEALLNSTRDRFKTARAPDGTAWPKLSKRTLAERKRKGRAATPLVLSGQLRGSIRYQATQDRVEIGTNKVYAGIHQFGGTIERGARTAILHRLVNHKTDKIQPRFVKKRRANFSQFAAIGDHSITIPARPYLGLSLKDVEVIGEIVTDYLDEAVGGGA